MIGLPFIVDCLPNALRSALSAVRHAGLAQSQVRKPCFYVCPKKRPLSNLDIIRALCLGASSRGGDHPPSVDWNIYNTASLNVKRKIDPYPPPRKGRKITSSLLLSTLSREESLLFTATRMPSSINGKLG